MVDKLMVTDSSGSKSASLTIALVAFVVCTGWVGLSAFEELWGLKIRPFDAGVCAAYLTPCLMLYWGRRNTAAKTAAPAAEEESAE